MRETVCIVGSHPNTRDYAPFDADVDIWVFNEVLGLGKVPRADAVFQMHLPAIWKNPTNRNDPNHYEWLKNTTVPVYMLEQYPDVPASVRYPLVEIIRDLGAGPVGRSYFTSSVAYAVALAAYLGYRRIEIYGVEMETNTEYYAQRDGVYFWIGVAIGCGVEVYVHPDSGLFKSPLYGYEGDIELHRSDFEERLSKLDPLADEAKRQLDAIRTQQAELMEIAIHTKWPEREAATRKFFKSIKAQTQAVIDWGALSAAAAENRRYIEKAEAMTEAAGQVLFSRQEFEQTAAKAQEEMEKYEALMGNLGGQVTIKWREVENSNNEPMPKRERLARDYIDGHNKYLDAAHQYGRCMGAMRENIELMNQVDQYVRMAGGRKSELVLIEARNREAVCE